MKRLIIILLLFIPLYLSGQVVTTNVSYATGPRTYLDVINDGNTKGWYISDSTATITKDGTDSTSVWADYLGSGRDLLAADNTKAQPIWSATGILFNGTTNFLHANAFTFNQPCFFYLVMKHITWTSAEIIFDGNVTGRTRLYQYDSTPELVASADSPTTPNDNLVLDTWGIVRVLFNGASSIFQINATSATTGDFGARNAEGFTLGYRPDTQDRFGNFEVTEIILRNYADSDADQTLIVNYLNAKYTVF